MRIRSLLTLLNIIFFSLSFQPVVAQAAPLNTTVSNAENGLKPAYQLAKSVKSSARKTYGKSTPPENEKFAAIVVDAASGQVLYEKNAGEMRYPASLTKMMTLYLTFNEMNHGKLKMGDRMRISKRAASQPETNINLKEGSTIRVEDAIEALVVRSANDAAVVLAEHIGGTQWSFAQMMNKKARELGMRDTVFRNPHGLPDNGQYTNAYDMARISIALRRDFPQYYKYFKTQKFQYGGTTYTSHNRILKRYNGADGIKTGYIRASGFNVATSVQKRGYNLVAVVMGGKSSTERDDMMIRLLDRTFAELSRQRKSHLAQSSNIANHAQTF